MNKKVIIISALVIIVAAFVAYDRIVLNKPSSTQVANTKQTQTSGSNTPPQQTAVAYKDGTYVGTETSSIYGSAKVQVVVSGGQITDVQFLVYPNDRRATIVKSNMAMPIIKQEVIQSQSANVNVVSGATQTSDAFIQSISSALSQAS